MPSWLVLLVLYIISVNLLGTIPTIIGFSLYFLHPVVPLPIFAGLVILFIVLYSFALHKLQGSISAVLFGWISLAVVAVGWVISRLARISWVLGHLLPVSKIFDWFVSKYPGEGFVKEVRRNFVSRAEAYIENGVVEVDESSEDLAREAQEYYNSAGTTLSNGEVLLAVGLAVVGMAPGELFGINIPSGTAAALSIVFVLIVMLRLSILDVLLFENPSSDQNPSRLLVIRDWNQGVAGGSFGFWRVVILKATWGISKAAYEFYLDWVFYESLVRNEPRNINLISKYNAARSLLKPFLAIVIADSYGITYREAAERWAGGDIFQLDEYPHLEFAQGEYVDELVASAEEE